MLYTLRFFSLQNAVCFIMLTCLVPALFTFHIQGVLKLKKKKFSAKGLTSGSKKGNKIYYFFPLENPRTSNPSQAHQRGLYGEKYLPIGTLQLRAYDNCKEMGEVRDLCCLLYSVDFVPKTVI